MRPFHLVQFELVCTLSDKDRCDHCTEMITEFRNVAFTYAAFSNVKVWPLLCSLPATVLLSTLSLVDGKVAKVNVDNEEALVKQFGVKRLPTILLFKAGSSRSDTIEYPLEAERTANDMVDFMNHYIGFEVESKKVVSNLEVVQKQTLISQGTLECNRLRYCSTRGQRHI